ncbi:MAG: hypothetical protein WBV39_04725 [Rudaea sp.]
MKLTSTREAPAANDPCAAAEESVTTAPAVAAELVGAWTRLLAVELKLARRSLGWLLIGAIAVPVIGLSVWLGFCVLLVAGMQMYTQSWILASLFGAGVQLLGLTILLCQLHCWAHDLALPQSRAALARVLEKLT